MSPIRVSAQERLPLHRPREDGLTHPADTSRTNLAAELAHSPVGLGVRRLMFAPPPSPPRLPSPPKPFPPLPPHPPSPGLPIAPSPPPDIAHSPPPSHPRAEHQNSSQDAAAQPPASPPSVSSASSRDSPSVDTVRPGAHIASAANAVSSLEDFRLSRKQRDDYRSSCKCVRCACVRVSENESTVIFILNRL
jgi:hypothetical protein